LQEIPTCVPPPFWILQLRPFFFAPPLWFVFNGSPNSSLLLLPLPHLFSLVTFSTPNRLSSIAANRESLLLDIVPRTTEAAPGLRPHVLICHPLFLRSHPIVHSLSVLLHPAFPVLRYPGSYMKSPAQAICSLFLFSPPPVRPRSLP